MNYLQKGGGQIMSIDLILSDGSILSNLEVNGNCLVSENDIPDEQLTNEMLANIKVNDVEYENVVLVSKWKDENKTWLAFRQKTDDEIWKEEYMANIDYISMTAGIQLEE